MCDVFSYVYNKIAIDLIDKYILPIYFKILLLFCAITSEY